MISKALNTVADRLENVLVKRGFVRKKINENIIQFESQNENYFIIFSDDKICLLKGDVNCETNNLSESTTKISEWLFKPESSTQKDIELIASDFLEEFTSKNSNKKSSNSMKNSSEKAENDGLHFFLNRLINLFPELKPLANKEKDTYEKFRYVTFIKQNFVPLFLSLIKNSEKKDDKFRKLFNVLNNFYDDGNMDVRSTITVIILNSIEDEKLKCKIAPMLSKELQDAFEESYKLRGKKIKPEKLKKTLLSKMIEANKN